MKSLASRIVKLFFSDSDRVGFESFLLLHDRDVEDAFRKDISTSRIRLRLP